MIEKYFIDEFNVYIQQFDDDGNLVASSVPDRKVKEITVHEKDKFFTDRKLANEKLQAEYDLSSNKDAKKLYEEFISNGFKDEAAIKLSGYVKDKKRSK